MHRTVAVVLVLLAAGCNQEPVVLAPDLGPLSCAAIYECGTACPPTELGTCIPACIANGSQDAMVYFAPLENCSRPACYEFRIGFPPPPCAQPASPACMTCVMTRCKAEADTCLAH